MAIPFKKTHYEYVTELSLINSDIDVLEKYINSNTPILHRCKKHNIQWKVVPQSILQGCGCIECGREKLSEKLHKSHDLHYWEMVALSAVKVKEKEKFEYG